MGVDEASRNARPPGDPARRPSDRDSACWSSGSYTRPRRASTALATRTRGSRNAPAPGASGLASSTSINRGASKSLSAIRSPRSANFGETPGPPADGRAHLLSTIAARYAQLRIAARTTPTPRGSRGRRRRLPRGRRRVAGVLDRSAWRSCWHVGRQRRGRAPRHGSPRPVRHTRAPLMIERRARRRRGSAADPGRSDEARPLRRGSGHDPEGEGRRRYSGSVPTRLAIPAAFDPLTSGSRSRRNSASVLRFGPRSIADPAKCRRSISPRSPSQNRRRPSGREPGVVARRHEADQQWSCIGRPALLVAHFEGVDSTRPSTWARVGAAGVEDASTPFRLTRSAAPDGPSTAAVPGARH